MFDPIDQQTTDTPDPYSNRAEAPSNQEYGDNDINPNNRNDPPQRSSVQEIISSLRNGIEINFGRNNNRFTIDLAPRRQRPLIDYGELKAFLGPLPNLHAAVGWSVDQQPVSLDFTTDQWEHLLITGEAKSGKSEMLRTILADLASNTKPSHIQFALIDGFRHSRSHNGYAAQGLAPFEYLPHTLAYTSHSPDEASELLAFIRDELEYRSQHEVTTPLILLAIDNFQDLLDTIPDGAIDHLITIAQMGTSAGVRLILSGMPSADDTTYAILDSGRFARIVGKVPDGETAEIATAILESNAEYLHKKGEFLWLDGTAITHFLGAKASEADFKRLINGIYQHKLPILLANSFTDRDETPFDAEPEYLYEYPEVTPSPQHRAAIHDTTASYDYVEASPAVEPEPQPQPEPQLEEMPAERAESLTIAARRPSHFTTVEAATAGLSQLRFEEEDEQPSYEEIDQPEALEEEEGLDEADDVFEPERDKADQFEEGLIESVPQAVKPFSLERERVAEEFGADSEQPEPDSPTENGPVDPWSNGFVDDEDGIDRTEPAVEEKEAEIEQTDDIENRV